MKVTWRVFSQLNVWFLIWYAINSNIACLKVKNLIESPWKLHLGIFDHRTNKYQWTFYWFKDPNKLSMSIFYWKRNQHRHELKNILTEIWCALKKSLKIPEFRIRKSKKNRKHKGKKKKYKRTNNELQNITHKTKYRVTRTPLNSVRRVNSSSLVLWIS